MTRDAFRSFSAALRQGRGWRRFRQILEVLPHFFGQCPHADAGKVVDGESGVSGVGRVHGEDAFVARAEDVVFHPGLELGGAHGFGQILEKDLQEDPRARGGFILIQMDDGEDVPADGIRGQDVAEEASDIPQSVRLVPVDGVVVLCERLFKKIGPQAVELGKSFAEQAEELGICLLLGAALHDHRGEFVFLARGELDLHQFVGRFLEVERRHDGQVDRPPQVDEIGVCLIFDLDGAVLFSFVVVGALVLGG